MIEKKIYLFYVRHWKWETKLKNWAIWSQSCSVRAGVTSPMKNPCNIQQIFTVPTPPEKRSVKKAQFHCQVLITPLLCPGGQDHGFNWLVHYVCLHQSWSWCGTDGTYRELYHNVGLKWTWDVSTIIKLKMAKMSKVPGAEWPLIFWSIFLFNPRSFDLSRFC